MSDVRSWMWRWIAGPFYIAADGATRCAAGLRAAAWWCYRRSIQYPKHRPAPVAAAREEGE